MAIDELQKYKVNKLLTEFCDSRIPVHVKKQIKLSFQIRGNYVTLYENRKSYLDNTAWIKEKIAQFRYDEETITWSLFWWRHTGKWYLYERMNPSLEIKDLINEVNKDPFGIFWG
jgi:hypothetical protein